MAPERQALADPISARTEKFHCELYDARAIPYGVRHPLKKESLMAWKAPKIVEVPVGMEINMYACAARK